MKKIFLSISIAAAVFGFTSCYDAIFYNIRTEVPLEDGVINGYTNSIVRYQEPDGTEFLYLQNGNVYYKQISDDTDKKILTKNQNHDKWTKDSSAPEGISYSYFDQEFSGTYSCKLASDSKYVYLLGATPEYDESSSRNILKNFKLYCYSKENGWKSVDAVNTILKKYESTLAEDKYMMDSSIQLFCTNTPQNAHRKAYIRIGGGSPYYSWMSAKQAYGNDFTVKDGVMNCGIIELNGTDTDIANVVPLGDGKIGTLEKTGAGKNTTSVVYANDKVYFLDYLASATNETKNSPATWVYYGFYDTKNKKNLLNSIPVEIEVIDSLGNIEVLETGAEKDPENGYKSKLVDLLEAFLSEETYYELKDGKPTSISLSEKIKDENVNLKTISTLDSLSEAHYYLDGEKGNQKPKKIEKIITTSGCADSILSMCVTNDSIILGTYEKGAYRVKTDSGKPETSTSDFTTNADSVMYNPYIVRMLFCTDPSLGETADGSALYSALQFRYTESSASASYKNVGLWSYYNSKENGHRNNWNKE